MALVSYFLQVLAFAACFAITYQLLLARTAMFSFNRIFLWVGIVAPFLLPLVTLPVGTIELSGPLVAMLPETVTASATKVSNQSVNLDTWLYGGYVAIAALMIGRLVMRHLQMNRFLRGKSIVFLKGYKTYLHTDMGPGSYWTSILLNEDAAPQQVIDHEIAHIRQRHYLDILLFHLLAAIFWPNFLLHFFGRQLKLVHEYQADASAMQAGFGEYAAQLLAGTFGVKQIPITHQFFHHPIKQRIMMLKKTRSTKAVLKHGFAAIGMALCLSGAGLLVLSGCTKPSAPKEMVYERVDINPEFDGEIANYLTNTIHYPESARKAGLEGRVGIKFVVHKSGKVKDAQVLRSSGVAALDNEALRAVLSMPDWKPGMQNGQPVNVYFSLPITFKLD